MPPIPKNPPPIPPSTEGAAAEGAVAAEAAAGAPEALFELPDVLRPAWAEIDLGALVANFRRLRETVAPARVLAVI
ncbi:MAG TPA: hypothetical protein VF150_11550, partial [Thermoanaerobaculia bacterium]